MLGGMVHRGLNVTSVSRPLKIGVGQSTRPPTIRDVSTVRAESKASSEKPAELTEM
jgi:hypothetical protein